MNAWAWAAANWVDAIPPTVGVVAALVAFRVRGWGRLL